MHSLGREALDRARAFFAGCTRNGAAGEYSSIHIFNAAASGFVAYITRMVIIMPQADTETIGYLLFGIDDSIKGSAAFEANKWLGHATAPVSQVTQFTDATQANHYDTQLTSPYIQMPVNRFEEILSGREAPIKLVEGKGLSAVRLVTQETGIGWYLHWIEVPV